jgi:hypothetical protein
MKFLKLIALLLFVLSSASPVMAQALWNGTTYGMSPAKVKSLVPNASKPEESPGAISGGSIELLRLSGVEIVGHTFTASFFFKNSKLNQVTLSADEELPFDSRINTFKSLTEALRVKYGKELSTGSSGGVLPTMEANWQSGRTNIAVLVMGMGEGQSILNVNYQVRLAAEAGKL